MTLPNSGSLGNLRGSTSRTQVALPRPRTSLALTGSPTQSKRVAGCAQVTGVQRWQCWQVVRRSVAIFARTSAVTIAELPASTLGEVRLRLSRICRCASGQCVDPWFGASRFEVFRGRVLSFGGVATFYRLYKRSVLLQGALMEFV